MIEIINSWLFIKHIGGDFAVVLSHLILILFVLSLSIIANFITKKIILLIVHKIVEKSANKWDDIFYKRKVFAKFSHIAPALVFLFFLPEFHGYQHIVEKSVYVYLSIICLLLINSIFDAIVEIYSHYEISKERPIKGYVELIQIFLFIIGFIFILGIVFKNFSPWKVLSGIGALTAIILLLFKDSLLGLVASIVVSSHDMVRIGDWIEMPKFDADGEVIDITLNTVKVQNWDKTITNIPAYSLVSDSFKNWRGMQLSGGRRIKRAINIDMTSIKFCDERLLDRFSKIQFISEYVNSKEKEVAEYNEKYNIDENEVVNGRRLTNIGTFRAYIYEYLKKHPKINKNMTLMVRQLSPNDNGLPLEIYVFSKDILWENYENIQSDIFDHILAVIPEFELRIFQNPTGSDLKSILGK